MTRRRLLACSPAVLLGPSIFLGGCSSEPVKKEPEKPAEPVTGLTGLFRCFQQARSWAMDVQILRLNSIHITEVKSQPGKAAAWQAIFVSPSLGKSRAYTFSVFDASVTLRKGIYPDSATDWSKNGKPFSIQAAKVDTDVIWATAAKKGEAYSKKNPDMPISYVLEVNDQTNNPAWRVIWGESASSSSFSVLADASTGQFLEILH